MTSLQRERGGSLELGRRIGEGGEGRIYEVAGEPRLVAKIYTKPTNDQASKLAVMLARPPDDPGRQRNLVSVAWPTERVYDEHGMCLGFLMPYIGRRNSFPLLKLYNPRDRQQTLSHIPWTWKHLLYSATNLARVINILHKSGYIVGDVNESNILVSTDAFVTLVDCDSIQIRRENGQFFRCTVGKPEYTPPELQGRNFGTINRAVYHDDFGLAVLIFQMLMEGIHPFTGVWQSAGDPPTLEQNIQAGNCPYISNRILVPPPHALPFTILPPLLQSLVTRCFGEGHRTPSRRPTADEWHQALQNAIQEIVSCDINGQHWYSRHLYHCPWCKRMSSGIPDPFPSRYPAAMGALTSRPTTQLAPPVPVISQQYPTYPTPSFYPTYSTGSSQLLYPLTGNMSIPAVPSNAPLIWEILLSIFGIFGVGWFMARRRGLGICLLICSFLFYLPFISTMFQKDSTCATLLIIGAIVFNAIHLRRAIITGST